MDALLCGVCVGIGLGLTKALVKVSERKSQDKGEVGCDLGRLFSGCRKERGWFWQRKVLMVGEAVGG